MNLQEKHPDIVNYIKQMENILEKNNSPILLEYKKMAEEKDVFDFFLWLNKLFDQNLLPPEINEPLTNLYWGIR